jgi:hypothetical protein
MAIAKFEWSRKERLKASQKMAPKIQKRCSNSNFVARMLDGDLVGIYVRCTHLLNHTRLSLQADHARRPSQRPERSPWPHLLNSTPDLPARALPGR